MSYPRLAAFAIGFLSLAQPARASDLVVERIRGQVHVGAKKLVRLFSPARVGAGQLVVASAESGARLAVAGGWLDLGASTAVRVEKDGSLRLVSGFVRLVRKQGRGPVTRIGATTFAATGMGRVECLAAATSSQAEFHSRVAGHPAKARDPRGVAAKFTELACLDGSGAVSSARGAGVTVRTGEAYEIHAGEPDHSPHSVTPGELRGMRLTLGFPED